MCLVCAIYKVQGSLIVVSSLFLFWIKIKIMSKCPIQLFWILRLFIVANECCWHVFCVSVALKRSLWQRLAVYFRCDNELAHQKPRCTEVLAMVIFWIDHKQTHRINGIISRKCVSSSPNVSHCLCVQCALFFFSVGVCVCVSFVIFLVCLPVFRMQNSI